MFNFFLLSSTANTNYEDGIYSCISLRYGRGLGIVLSVKSSSTAFFKNPIIGFTFALGGEFGNSTLGRLAFPVGVDTNTIKNMTSDFNIEYMQIGANLDIYTNTSFF